MQRTPGVLAMLLSVASLGLLQPPDCKVLQQCLFSFCKLSSLESTRLSATSTPAHTFTAVLPSAAGFPEIEADTFLDWNSQQVARHQQITLCQLVTHPQMQSLHYTSTLRTVISSSNVLAV